MNRRELLGTGVGAAAVASAAGVLSAGTAFAGKQSKRTLAEHALECIRASEACITACLDQRSIEASSINACRECIAVCETLVTLEATNSRHLREYAALCAKVCRDCEAACREDGDDEACRACAEACAACAASCEAFAR